MTKSRQLLGLIRIRVYRECLTTIYAGGLRSSKGRVCRSRILGHRSLRTTQIYTHLTREVQATLTDPLTDLTRDL